MKYLLFVAFLVVIVMTAGCVGENKNTGVTPEVPKVTVYFFYGEECPHCHTVMPFIQNLSKKYPEVNFVMLETWHNKTNSAQFELVNKKLGITQAGVPEVVVNDVVLIGSQDIPDKLEGVIARQLNKTSN
ncbi:MAG: thioredoxin family protein [Methanoregula sp.]|nr:thioredoxin family protein [Methanoregula sp.]